MKLVAYCHQIIRRNFDDCLSLRHFVCALSVLGALMAPCNSSNAQRAPSRAPANFVPDDQIEPLPLEQKLWIQEILIDDDAGVLNAVRSNFEHWQEKEEYVRRWKVEAVGPLATPTQEQKKAYLMKQLLRYADKRISGEIKNSEEGSTFHNIGQVEQALSPKVEAKISSNIKVKVRAKVLRGEAIILLNNPWIDNSITVKLNGRVNVHMEKTLEDFGVRTAVDFDVKDGIYVARVEKPLTEEITARISATQDMGDAPFTGDSDSRIELSYTRGF